MICLGCVFSFSKRHVPHNDFAYIFVNGKAEKNKWPIEFVDVIAEHGNKSAMK